MILGIKTMLPIKATIEMIEIMRTPITTGNIHLLKGARTNIFLKEKGSGFPPP